MDNNTTDLQLIRPGDASFDAVRQVWNGMIDRRPALIARCKSVADVQAALQLARREKLALTVRGGGHGISGKAVADGALMIDLSLLNQVEIDTADNTASVGGGARLGDLDKAAQAHGLATTAGVDSRTGAGGLTLGGGQGFLARRFGLTIDNLLAAQVVLADGQVVWASAEEHPDLFWALRGGGGNFGVVTTFKYQLHKVGPEVFVGMVYAPLHRAPELLRLYRDYAANSPRELSCYAMTIMAPPGEPLPEAQWGKSTVVLLACYSGDLAEGQRAMQPLMDIPDPLFASFTPMPYATLQQSFDGSAPDGERFYWKSHYIRELSDTGIDTLVAHLAELPGPFSNVFFEPLGGAVADVGPTDTPFPHRDANFSLGIQAGWSDASDDQASINWARALYSAMTPFATGGAYSNYIDFDDDDKVAHAFGPNTQRLLKVKQQYDPQGCFAGNKTL